MTETESVTEAETASSQIEAETASSEIVVDLGAGDESLPEAELAESAARGHVRIRAHAARLFNDGLAAARAGQPVRARDHFAACVYWYPHDLEARSALALACLESGDADAAHDHWRKVLDQRPNDSRALRGLLLATPAPPPDPQEAPEVLPVPSPSPAPAPEQAPDAAAEARSDPPTES